MEQVDAGAAGPLPVESLTEANGLVTLQDFIRWGASRFNEAELYFGHGTDNALDEAAALVLFALHLDQSLPPAYLDCRLTPPERLAVLRLIERRIEERKPLAYLTRHAIFAGYDFHVDERVLVPRSPLAEVVEQGFAPWLDPEGIGRLLDLGTGCGCIGIAAALYLPQVSVDLVDVSPSALAVAESNLAHYGLQGRVRALESDLFGALGGQCYDVIVSNPPYVASDELSALPSEYQAEPSLALAGGRTGLDAIVRILAHAHEHLNPAGILVVECGNSADALVRRFPQAPFTWLEFERGGEGVFLLTREQLVELVAASGEGSAEADGLAAC